jgi:hypothetical protein
MGKMFDDEPGPDGRHHARNADDLRSVSIGGRPGVYNRTDESTSTTRAIRTEGRDENGKEVRSLAITPATRELGRA